MINFTTQEGFLSIFTTALISVGNLFGDSGCHDHILMRNLSDLGYSTISEDVQTVEQIIDYLQQQNRAIAINTYSLFPSPANSSRPR